MIFRFRRAQQGMTTTFTRTLFLKAALDVLDARILHWAQTPSPEAPVAFLGLGLEIKF